MKQFILLGSPSWQRPPLGMNAFIKDFDTLDEARQHGLTCTRPFDICILSDGIGLSMDLRLSWFHIWNSKAERFEIPYQSGRSIAEATAMTFEETQRYAKTGNLDFWSPYGERSVDEINRILDEQG